MNFCIIFVGVNYSVSKKYYLTKNFRNYGDLDIWTDGTYFHHKHIKRLRGDVFSWEIKLLENDNLYSVDSNIIATSDNEEDIYAIAAVESLSPRGKEEASRYVEENYSALNWRK